MGPAWWIPGAHLQTAWARIARSRRLVTFEREVLTTPDDDDLVLDHVPGPPASPRVLLLHGLEGSAHSLHTQGLALLVARAGWRCTVLNFRSCARDARDIEQRLPNRRPRLYHSGETGDLDFVVRTLAAREPATPALRAGLLAGRRGAAEVAGRDRQRQRHPRGRHHLGPVRSRGRVPLPGTAAWAGSTPPTSRPGSNRRRWTCCSAFRARRRTSIPIASGVARTFHDFDECLTAPLHGFASADDYYRRASSLPFLAHVAVPTLCLSSEDDPFFPGDDVFRARDAASAAVRFEITPWGGHTGFVTGAWPWRPHYWAEERAVDWLRAHAARTAGGDA